MSSIARLGRVAQCCIRNKNSLTITPVRKGSSQGFRIYRDEQRTYRKSAVYSATLIMYVTTVWMGINMYHDPGHWLTGHFPAIDPTKFTDEELGIPPDEEDIYPPGYIPLKDRQ